MAEIGAIAIVHERENGAADRDPGLARVARLFPGGAVRPDLVGLLQMEGLAGFVVLERRALQVHPELCRPDRGGVRAGAPPDPLTQAFRMRLEAKQPGWIGKHRLRIWLRKAFAAQQVKEDLRMTASHVAVGLALCRPIAEILPPIDHLLGRTAADAELQPSSGDEICCPRILDHVERVLVAMSITAVPISIRLVRAPTAASSGKGEAS